MLDDVGALHQKSAECGSWHSQHQYFAHGFNRNRGGFARQQRFFADRPPELHMAEVHPVASSDHDATVKWEIHPVRTLARFYNLGAGMSAADFERASDLCAGSLVEWGKNRIGSEQGGDEAAAQDLEEDEPGFARTPPPLAPAPAVPSPFGGRTLELSLQPTRR